MIFLMRLRLLPWRRVCLWALMAYFVAMAGAFILQRHFLYFPNDIYLSPHEAGTEAFFSELSVKTEDGIELKGWYAKAKDNKPTLILFHGNADSLRKMDFVAAPYVKEGYGFLLTEYRGFSGFKGKPTEEGLYADARAFVRGVLAQGVPERDLVFFGHSLGTGVAVEMAKEFSNAFGLMLLSPYLSMTEMAQLRFPLFPSRYMVWDKFDSASKIGTLHMPVLIAHGTWDVVVPFDQGKALYDLAPEPKEFHAVDKGLHNNLFINPFSTIALEWLPKCRACGD
ncbi:MAG: alpha/beta hydrolase [Alphaproteobacteria bacterium]|nr:alpha/beta hydrolase [Alphaproteobacteria bacterium]